MRNKLCYFPALRVRGGKVVGVARKTRPRIGEENEGVCPRPWVCYFFFERGQWVVVCEREEVFRLLPSCKKKEFWQHLGVLFQDDS